MADVNLDPCGPSTPSARARARAFAYLVHQDGALGTELWRTDGTAAGAAMI